MMKRLLSLSIVILLCGCDTAEKSYSSFSDIPQDDGIRSWLPDSFPESATDIKFTSNVDLNTFDVYFSLPPHEKSSLFDAKGKAATTRGIDFLKQQDQNVTNVTCITSDYNKFGDKSLNHYLAGKLKEEDQYYLSSINNDQYVHFCQPIAE